VGSSSSVKEVTDGPSSQHLVLSRVHSSLRSGRVSVRSHTSVRRIRLTMVSRRDLYRLSDSGPVVSSMGTTRVGTVPFMLILRVSAGAYADVSEPHILEVRRREVLASQLARIKDCKDQLTSPLVISTSLTSYSSSEYPFSCRQSRGTVDHTDVCQLWYKREE
jgi:hypothetical protein